MIHRIRSQEVVDARRKYHHGHGSEAGGLVTYAILNPSDKHASITLSGSNLIATKTADDQIWRSVRSDGSTLTGKHYFELEIDESNENHILFGFATANTDIASYCGVDVDSYSRGNGAFKYHNGTPTAQDPISGGIYQRIGLAVDFSGVGMMWSSIEGVWDGVSAQTDPANALNPLYTNMKADNPAEAFFFMLTLYDMNDVVTFIPDLANMDYSSSPQVPTGFIRGWQV